MNEIAENREVNSKAIDTISQFAEKLTNVENDIADIKIEVVEIKNIVNN